MGGFIVEEGKKGKAEMGSRLVEVLGEIGGVPEHRKVRAGYGNQRETCWEAMVSIGVLTRPGEGMIRNSRQWGGYNDQMRSVEKRQTISQTPLISLSFLDAAFTSI